MAHVEEVNKIIVKKNNCHCFSTVSLTISISLQCMWYFGIFRHTLTVGFNKSINGSAYLTCKALRNNQNVQSFDRLRQPTSIQTNEASI